MKKKNIAFLINTLGAGGAERVVSRLGDILQERYNISILLVDSADMAYTSSGEILDLGGQGRNYHSRVFHSCLRIRRIIKEKEIECVISFLPVPNLINLIFTPRIRRIISIRGYGEGADASSMKNRLCRLLYKKADWVVAVSEEIREKYITDYGIGENRIKAIANPYNVKQIEKLTGEKVEKTVLDFMEAHECAATMGRLIEGKGCQYLLESLSLLLKKREGAGLIVIGSGSYEKTLRELADQLGVAESVLFLGQQSNPFKYLRLSRLYVSATLSEGFPNALVEAMACGIPVIQTDCRSGPGEILREGFRPDRVKECEKADYGILIPDFEPVKEDRNRVRQYEEALARVWEEMLRDGELAAFYGEKARERAMQFSEERCMEQYIGVIENE